MVNLAVYTWRSYHILNFKVMNLLVKLEHTNTPHPPTDIHIDTNGFAIAY